MMLHDLVIRAAQDAPQRIALRSGDESLSYAQLDRLSAQIANVLQSAGLTVGGRVGVWLEKSGTTVAAMQGALRAGGCYVPLDPDSPAARVGIILQNCPVEVLITTRERAAAAPLQLAPLQVCLCVDDEDFGDLTWREVLAASSRFTPRQSDPATPAYILHTSGSTGVPKGVVHTHASALAFVEWAAEELAAAPSDCFASHAPLHFDLSVLDFYVAFAAGGTVALVPPGAALSPKRLVQFIATMRPTVWYSVPSALLLMMQFGGLLELPEISLRAILFAGEPFPTGPLRTLMQRWPQARYLNLYGPTETNVCTYYEAQSPPQELSLPIGRACCGDRVWIAGDADAGNPPREGELMVQGPTVMQGYAGAPPLAGRPYATGDLVRLEEDGNYHFLGRIDNMVKLRGNRIELGEIESVLLDSPDVAEAAVIVAGEGLDAQLIACVTPRPGASVSLLALKQFSSIRLPRHMLIAGVQTLDALPRTPNGKVDRRKLLELIESTTA